MQVKGGDEEQIRLKNRYRNKTQGKGCGQRIAEVASGVTVYQFKVRRDTFYKEAIRRTNPVTI